MQFVTAPRCLPSRNRSVPGIIFSILFLLTVPLTNAQTPQKDVLAINAAIDRAVVNRSLAVLDTLYGEDFVFTHGTGTVDNKASWLKSVANPNQQFVKREQDSTTVEVHPELAVVRGKINIVRRNGATETSYGIWYARIFAFRQKRWQLISHFTTKEWHNH